MNLFSFTYSIPYIIVFLILCLLSYMESRRTISSNKSFKTCFYILLLFWGCRGYVGWDWMTYYPMYQIIDKLWDFSSQSFILVYSDEVVSEAIEPGFILYTSILKTIFDNYHFFIFVNSLIFLIAIGRFIKKYSNNYALSFLVLFAIYQGLVVDLLRNSLALSIFLYAISFKKKPSIYALILLSLLGILFHKTFILLIPLFFLDKIRLPKQIIWLIFILGNVLMLLHIPVANVFVSFITSIFGENLLTQRMLSYATSDIYGSGVGITFGYIFRFIMFCIIMNNYDQIRNNSKLVLILNAYILYAIVYFCMRDVGIFVERMEILYCFANIILYPQLIYMIRNKYQSIYKYMIIIFCLLRLYVSTNDIMYNYITCFNKISYEEQANIKRPAAKELME